MDLIKVADRFSTQEECLKFLEELRWGKEPRCIHCGSIRVGRKNHNHIEDGWNCYDCGSSFSVIAGTMFHKTRIPLRACLKSTVCRVRTAHQPLKAPKGIKRTDSECDRDPEGV